jgi:hypothetical protein
MQHTYLFYTAPVTAAAIPAQSNASFIRSSRPGLFAFIQAAPAILRPLIIHLRPFVNYLPPLIKKMRPARYCFIALPGAYYSVAMTDYRTVPGVKQALMYMGFLVFIKRIALTGFTVN